MEQRVTLPDRKSIDAEQGAAIIEDLLLPPSQIPTADLVERSALKCIAEWVAIGREANQLAFGLDCEVEKTFAAVACEDANITYRRLSSPIFRGWLWWTAFSLYQGTSHHDLTFAQMQLWNNMKHSLVEPGNFEEWFGVVDGWLCTWDPRLLCKVGNQARVRVHRFKEHLTIYGENQQVLWDGTTTTKEVVCIHSHPGVVIKTAPVLPGTDIVVRNDIPLLRLKLSGTNQRDTGIEIGNLDSSDIYSADENSCVEAAAMLREVWPEEYSDFSKTLQVVVPRKSDLDTAAKGMTVSSHQGAIWIMADDSMSIYESMVHEQSHVKLRYVEEFLPILSPHQTETRFKVAWRKDPRPILGIYEGIYVTVHCVVAFKKALESGAVPSAMRDQWHRRASNMRTNVLEALPIMEAHAQFTDEGCVFPHWARRAVA